MARNSDGSYDAVDSGSGFGKDYHGQDAFGERIGGSGIGGNHFGGKAAGDFSGADELGEGHFTERYTDYGQVTQTEAPDTSAFEGEANEVADSMKDSLRSVNEETAENSNTGSTMDTSFQIGGIEEEDKEKYEQELERAEEELNRTKEWAGQMRSAIANSKSSVDLNINNLDNKSISGRIANTVNNTEDKVIDTLESLAKSFGYDDFDRNKLKEAYKENGTEALRNARDELFERKEADIDKTVKGAQGRRDNFKSIVDSYKSSTTDKTKTSFTDKMKPSTEEDIEKYQQEWDKAEEDDKEKYRQELERSERSLNNVKEWADLERSKLAEIKSSFNNTIGGLNNKSITGRIANNVANTAIDTLEGIAKYVGYGFDRDNIEAAYKEGGTDALSKVADKVFEAYETFVDDQVKDAQSVRDALKIEVDSYKSPSTGTKISFGMKPSAKPGTNTSSVTADALGLQSKEEWEEMYKQELERYKEAKANKDSTKEVMANKDSTKEVPKEAPNRNDFGNHAADTLKGVTDRIADNTTAGALGIQSLEDFAKENGYDPNKLSTMKAYQSYQNKQIMKAIPGIVKQIGSYITERVKDAVNPSQLPERIRNTIARYNIATLIGAVILSIKSGAGLQASLDQALTMVDPEDQAAVSDYLEDVLNDEGTVTDLDNAFDDALAPEQNSATAELDESIVNIGRKGNTDYSGFNAGLGTTSDKDVKVFIARNVKADPILRKMISKIDKMGK